MGRRPTICLFVEHRCQEMMHSLYMIEPPLDLSHYDHDHMIDSEGFMTDSKYISPVLTFPDKNFLFCCASVTLGSKIYFLGGSTLNVTDKSLLCQVQVFDPDHPEQGMRSVAPMNAPKETPCVFVADGMIYVLGSALATSETDLTNLPGFNSTGFFECYDPSSDHWQVLSDPPLTFFQWAGANFIDSATVVGRRVFIGSPSRCAIYNLDTQVWDPIPSPKLADRFPCGSLFVQETASLYHLRGPGTWKPGTPYVSSRVFGDHPQVVKKGPLISTEEGCYDSSLLNSHCLVSPKKQVMAADFDLDENKFFVKFNPRRDLLHMGGRFFCYIVTAQLVDQRLRTRLEENSRGVLLKFFEEVPAGTDNGNRAKFRPLASFCYKIDTNFRNPSVFIRCSALGTVPDSWINAPLKEKQNSKLKHQMKASEALQIRSLSVKTNQKEFEASQRHHERKNSENGKAREYDLKNLKNLLAVREEENSRLVAELARKNELLKAYEAKFAKIKLLCN